MLRGKNVVLRPLSMGDLPFVNSWRNDLELIMQTQGIRFPKTKEMDEAWFRNVLNDTSNRNIYFGVDELESQKLIGVASLISIDYISGTGVWGLVIGEQSGRGKGYSVEILHLMLNYAFKWLNLRKVFGYPAAYNKATLAMHKHIKGIVQEGCLRKHVFFDGAYHDVLILSLFRDDYYKSLG
jgi:RimJ/RimL family protein N-acetyltransferase